MPSIVSVRLSLVVPLLVAVSLFALGDSHPAAAEAQCPKDLPGHLETLRGEAARARIDELYRVNPQARAQHEENLRALRAHGAEVTGNESYSVVSYKNTPVSFYGRLMNTLFPTLHAQAFGLDGDATLYYGGGDDWAELTISGSEGTISGVFGIVWGPFPGTPTISWYTKPWVGRWAICSLGACAASCAFTLGACGATCAQAFVGCGLVSYGNYRYCRSRGKSEDEC